MNKITESPFTTVFGFITVLTTLWGIVSIYKDVMQWGGLRFAALILAVIAVACSIPVFWQFFGRSPRKKLRLPFTERFIFTKVIMSWEIEESGSAHIKSSKTYLFLEPPQKKDLHDTAFGSEEFDIKKLDYNSEDAEIDDYERISENAHRIFWKPKIGQIQTGVPYTHQIRSHFPFNKEFDFKTMTIPANTLVARLELTISTKVPIDDVIVHKGEWSKLLTDPVEIAEQAKNVRRRNAPLPQVHNVNQATWCIDHMEAKSIYYCTILFKSNKPQDERSKQQKDRH